MAAAHYADADGTTQTMCGRQPENLTIVQAKEEVTCNSCRRSMRWLIHFHNMTWDQASRHLKSQYEANRLERLHWNCK